MKFCKDCKHISFLGDECRHKESEYAINIVTGDRKYYTPYDMRKSTVCGLDAKLFEPKLSMLAKIKGLLK